MKHMRNDALSDDEIMTLAFRIQSNMMVYHDDTPDRCWEYQGTWHDGKGYKKIKLNGRAYYVHRIMYMWYKAAIPEGYVLDHKCRNSGCCKPGHLEAVTVEENTRRGKGRWIYAQNNKQQMRSTHDNDPLHAETSPVGLPGDVGFDPIQG